MTWEAPGVNTGHWVNTDDPWQTPHDLTAIVVLASARGSFVPVRFSVLVQQLTRLALNTAGCGNWGVVRLGLGITWGYTGCWGLSGGTGLVSVPRDCTPGLGFYNKDVTELMTSYWVRISLVLRFPFLTVLDKWGLFSDEKIVFVNARLPCVA